MMNVEETHLASSLLGYEFLIQALMLVFYYFCLLCHKVRVTEKNMEIIIIQMT